MRELIGLRDDVYRRPLATALLRLGLEEGWRCVDVGAGGGDVSVALAEMVGRHGRVYAVDSDPAGTGNYGKSRRPGNQPSPPCPAIASIDPRITLQLRQKHDASPLPCSPRRSPLAWKPCADRG